MRNIVFPSSVSIHAVQFTPVYYLLSFCKPTKKSVSVCCCVFGHGLWKPCSIISPVPLEGEALNQNVHSHCAARLCKTNKWSKVKLNVAVLWIQAKFRTSGVLLPVSVLLIRWWINIILLLSWSFCYSERCATASDWPVTPIVGSLFIFVCISTLEMVQQLQIIRQMT